MNFREFDEQVARLRNAYSERAYPDERVKLMWQEFEKIPATAFKNIISRMIAEHRQPPMIPDIRAEVGQYQNVTFKEMERWDGVPRSNCPYCFGNGTYIAGKPDAVGTFAFRCHCEAGERDPRKKIPQFKQDHANLGFYWVDVRTKLLTLPEERK